MVGAGLSFNPTSRQEGFKSVQNYTLHQSEQRLLISPGQVAIGRLRICAHDHSLEGNTG